MNLKYIEGTINYMRSSSLHAFPLFKSENQSDLLAAIFFSEKALTIQELSRKLQVPYPTIHREVSRLLASGILAEERVGNYRFFEPNHASYIYRPLRDLLEAIAGPIPLLKRELISIDGIEWAALFGSWAHRLLGKTNKMPQDLDLLVIGTPKVREVNVACTAVGKELGRDVNPIILTSLEWKEETPFLRQVRSGGLVPIIDATKNSPFKL